MRADFDGIMVKEMLNNMAVINEKQKFAVDVFLV